MAEELRRFAMGGAEREDSFSGMNPKFSSALARMFAEAPPEIQQSLRIGSGYRSNDRQAQLWQAALAKYGDEATARRWVAPPGRSLHNHGYAADLKYLSPVAQDWAHKNAPKYGLAFPLSNEAWHVELAGARDQDPSRGYGGFGGAVLAGAQNLRAQSTLPAPNGAPQQPRPPQAPQPPQPPTDLAAMYGQSIIGAPPESSLMDIASLYLQQQDERKQRQAAEEEAAQIKRRALLASTGVAGMYG